MKKCLNPYSNGLPSRGATREEVELYRPEVLIPILMDYPLGAKLLPADQWKHMSLNPYSNGLPSRGRWFFGKTSHIFQMVLIPILMDYPLGAIPFSFLPMKRDLS